MMDIPLILYGIAGLVALVVGAEILVRSASSLAQRFGVSPLVVGLTVVAFGTSAPELAVSLSGALAGQGGIAVGNVVGSNIFNLLVVLGLTASVAPDIAIEPGVIAFDLPLVLAVSIACLPIFFTGHVIDRSEGGVFLIYYLAYTVFLVLDTTDHSALAPFSVKVLAFVIPILLLTTRTIVFRHLQRP